MQPELIVIIFDVLAYATVLTPVGCLAVYGLRYSKGLRESQRLDEVFERNQRNDWE